MDQTFVRMKKYYLTRQEQASLLTKRQNNSPEDYVECCSIIFKIGIIGEGEEREKGGGGTPILPAHQRKMQLVETQSSSLQHVSLLFLDLFLKTLHVVTAGLTNQIAGVNIPTPAHGNQEDCFQNTLHSTNSLATEYTPTHNSQS